MNALTTISQRLYQSQWEILPSTYNTLVQQFESLVKSGGIAAFVDDNEDGVCDDCGEEEDDCECEDMEMAMSDTAIIPVFGVLGKHLSAFEQVFMGGCSYDNVQSALKSVMGNPNIKNVILYFNSPGGEVIGCKTTADLIAKCGKDKTMVAYTDSLMASAAYKMASQCHYIYANEDALVGCVGVIMQHVDFSQQLKNEGVTVTTIKSGKYKDMGNPTRPLTDEDKAIFQAEVDKAGEDFRAYVTAKRDIAPEDMEGQVFAGEEAAKKNFVDGLVSDLDEVIAMIPRN